MTQGGNWMRSIVISKINRRLLFLLTIVFLVVYVVVKFTRTADICSSNSSSQQNSIIDFKHFGHAALLYRSQSRESQGSKNLTDEYVAGIRLIYSEKFTPHPFWLVIPGMGSNVHADNINSELFAEGMIKSFAMEDRLATSIYKRYCKSSAKNLVVDIGSNIGWYSALAIAHGCRAITVDGAKDALMYYAATVEMNGWHKKSSIVNSVVTNQREGTFVFNGWNTFSKDESLSLKEKASLYTSQTPRRMDSLVGDEVVAYLKVDIEGHEPDGFSSGKILFHTQHTQNKILNVLFEFTYRLSGKSLHNEYKQHVFDMLWSSGYLCFSITDIVQKISGWEEISSMLEKACGDAQTCGLNVWCTVSDADLFDELRKK